MTIKKNLCHIITSYCCCLLWMKQISFFYFFLARHLACPYTARHCRTRTGVRRNLSPSVKTDLYFFLQTHPPNTKVNHHSFLAKLIYSNQNLVQIIWWYKICIFQYCRAVSRRRFIDFNSFTFYSILNFTNGRTFLQNLNLNSYT